MRVTVFEQKFRRGNSYHAAINGWAYAIQRGIYAIAGKCPGWTFKKEGRAYEFDVGMGNLFGYRSRTWIFDFGN